jgi:plastocyanin
VRQIPRILVLLAVGAVAGDATATTAGGAGGGRGGYGGGDYGSGQSATTAGKAGSASGAARIAGFAFAPKTLTAKVGQKVTWKNQDAGVTHTVAAVDGSFASGRLTEGDTFSHVVRRAGTFAYHCSIHASMRGTVKVAG